MSKRPARRNAPKGHKTVSSQASTSKQPALFDPPYFVKHYGTVRLNADGPDELGLRRGQRGAIHSLVGHFTLRHDPALVVMPTGSGKTAVLMLLPFLEKSKRCLIVTPSALVREQIAEDFGKLSILRRTGLVPDDTQLPHVHELLHKPTSAKSWKQLEQFDVIVATPNAVSPADQSIEPPPADFFDLLLVDEAHHSPAVTWQALLHAFPNAKRALFTATPFRRDRKEIKGTIVFTYPLSEAAKDGVFGKLKFEPVTPDEDQDPDIAIAQKVEAALKADRDAGLSHSALIRADTRARADELLIKYEKNTKLKLRIVHSGHSVKHVRDTIAKLKERQLDGVVCVNMMGEGFDFPNLKIAGLHAPHRSLGVTLQFIGRFARTGDKTIGLARFFAVPAEIEGETARLFADDAAWEHLVQNLSENRVDAERELREQLATFEEPEINDESLEDLSLYSIRPARHVKVYDAGATVDLSQPFALPKPFETVYRRYSPENSCLVIVAREQQRPAWSDQLRFSRITYELLVIYFDTSSNLLFINSSRRANALYKALGEVLMGEVPSPLPLHQINRCTAGLSDVECFSVGMRNRLHTSKTESYRMLAGRRANQAVKRSDGRLFHRGHLFFGAREGTEKVTLGYSSASKFWSANGGHIPSLLKWCRNLAKKLSDKKAAGKIAGLESLAVGEELKAVPPDVIALEWNTDAYASEYQLTYASPSGTEKTIPLVEAGLRVDRAHSTKTSIRAIVEVEGVEWQIDYSPLDQPMFAAAKGKQPESTVHSGDDRMALVDYLNTDPLVGFTSSFGQFTGRSWFPASVTAQPIDDHLLAVPTWTGVDITRECEGKGNIHSFVRTTLLALSPAVIFYDHGPYEIADFVQISDTPSQVIVSLFHCKGSGESKPGSRIDDLYEVCGQVVKSLKIVNDAPGLFKHLKRRGTNSSKFAAGDLATAEKLLNSIKAKVFRIVAVQPGIAKKGLSQDCQTVLGAADEAIVLAGADRLSVWTSE